MTIVLSIVVNFILYLAFGSYITARKGQKFNFLMSILVGFFLYYCVFFLVCLPIMIKFRPLSMLTKIWLPIVIVLVLLSIALHGKKWLAAFPEFIAEFKKNKLIYLLLFLMVAAQIVIVTSSYNFTLDAAYYVANVATSVETNMMNVYDPFTGAWQDHFELRYFFATYQINDAVVCQITGIPALIQTKTIMAATIIILTNIVYYLIADELFANSFIAESLTNIKNKVSKANTTSTRNTEVIRDTEAASENIRDNTKEKVVLMLLLIFVMNLMFITIYTSSLFLMTRTYEGKAIVGNLSILTVFYLFIKLLDEDSNEIIWWMVFFVCFGSTTISSSANMLIPGELSVLMLPLVFIKKKISYLFKYLICALPGICFALAFVLYVKGYFVLYTYPR